MKKLLITSVILLGLGVAGVASAGHSWGNYHWARTTPSFTLKLGNNVTSAWSGHLAIASTDWSTSAVLSTAIVGGGTNNIKGRNTPKNCVPTDGRVEVCNESYGNNGWLGIAQIWISGGEHIMQGAVKLNDFYFDYPPYNTSEWRQMVMCQEVGHTFGLDHQDENFNNGNLGTCMDYTSDPGANQHPNAHDYAQLEAIYAHIDSFDSYDSSTDSGGGGGDSPGNSGGKGKKGGYPVAQNGDFENASEWGRAIGQDSKGRDNQFERDLGAGKKIITHVTWAD